MIGSPEAWLELKNSDGGIDYSTSCITVQIICSP